MPHNQQEEAAIDLCRRLIETPSESGNEKQAIDLLLNYYSQSGFTHLYVDPYGSLVASFRGKRQGPVLLLDGHIDTVPVPDPAAWSYPPFGAVIDENRLYGRGSSDMKGAVAAMAAAATQFLKASKGDFAGTLVLAGVVQEEMFEGVAARAISEYCRPDLVIIGEATALKLNIGQRGRAEIKVETFGIPAHSANPEKGKNAVYQMAGIIQQVQKIRPPSHPVLGPGILELTDIKSSPYPGASVVPSHCLSTYDRRLLPGETLEDVLLPLKAVLHQYEEEGNRSPKVTLARGKESCYTGQVIEAERFFPGWLFDEGEWFVQKALQCLKQAGLESRLSYYNFCTNGSHYAGEAGIPTLGFGPSYEEQAHTIDEYIELDQLLGAVRGYRALMEAFLT